MPATILPWIVIPLLYLSDKAPAGDDVTKFLSVSSSPLLVSLGAVILLLILLIIWHRKAGGIWRVIILRINRPEIKRSTWFALITLSLVSALLMTFPWVDMREPRVEAGYHLLGDIALNRREGPDWEMCKFWLDEPQQVKVLMLGKGYRGRDDSARY